MNRIKLIIVLLFIVKNTLAIANVKSSPISINNKPDLSKSGDLKVEEARFRDPMPEYYDQHQRDRNNFVTSYGGSSNYGYPDRYGLKYNSDRDRYNPTNRYGTTSPTILDSKYYIPGGMYNQQTRDPYAPNGLYNPSYSSKYPYDNYAHNYGSSYSPHSWDLDMDKGNGKSLWLPLAGVALLGAAAVLAANPMILHMGTMYGKRKRRSVDNQQNEAQKIAYRGYQQS